MQPSDAHSVATMLATTVVILLILNNYRAEKVFVCGLVNFDLALAYHFCLNRH